MQEDQPDVVDWVILFVLAFIWGSSFILIKYALFPSGQPGMSGIEVGASRMALASLSLLPITLKHRKWFRTHWKPLFVVGFFGNGLPAFLFAIAQTRIDSSLSGMLNSATPLFTLLVGVFFFAIRAERNKLIGVFIGLVAALILIGSGAESQMPNDPLYAGLALIGSFCYAISVNTIKSKLQSIPSLAIAGLALSFAGLPCIIYLIGSGFVSRLASEAPLLEAFGYVAILAVVGTALALVLFNRLVESTSAVFSSSVTYMLPVIAIGWGFWDGETVSKVQLACIAFILISVMLVGRRSSST